MVCLPSFGLWSLQVIGGAPSISYQLVRTTSSDELIVIGTSPASTDHSHSLNYSGPISLQFHDNSNQITLVSEDNHHSSSLAMRGPSGKGEFKLIKLDDPHKDIGIGSMTEYESWAVKTETGFGPDRRLLRHQDLTRDGHWIAVPNRNSDSNTKSSTWELWWYTPNAANMEDFKSYVMVDLELVQVDQTG